MVFLGRHSTNLLFRVSAVASVKKKKGKKVCDEEVGVSDVVWSKGNLMDLLELTVCFPGDPEEC